MVVFRLDAEGVFVESAGRGLARLGLEDGDAVGRSAFEDYPQIADTLRRALAGETIRYETKGLDPAAPWWFDSIIAPEEGGGAVGFALDVTERREAERRLELVEKRLGSILEHLPVVLFATDANGVFRKGRGRGLVALGEPGRDLLGKSLFDVFPQVAAEARRALDGESVHFVCHGIGPAGPWWYDTLLTPDPEFEGGLTGFAIDVSRRMRVQQELRDTGDRVKALSDQAADALLVHDVEGRIVEANQRACESLGYTRDELLDLSIGDLGRGDDLAELRTIWRTLRPGETRTITGFQRRKDGSEFPTEARIGLLRYGDRDLVLALVRDVAERFEAEKTRLRLEAKMRQSQKLESLGVLAGGIAHDFNNLLTGVIGNASLALMELPPGSPLRRTIEQIENAAGRAAELAQQMLAYSGRGRFVLEHLDLTDVIRTMEPLLESATEKRAALRWDLAGDLPPIVGDPAQLRQLVLSLVTNAADAIVDPGGTIALRTGIAAVDRRYLSATYVDDDLPPGMYVFVEVTDDGCGMDQRTRGRIFDPFYTTKTMGRGLGLAAALGIVRGHSGAIRVASAPGEGTTVRVLLPSAAEAIPDPDGEPEQAAPDHGTILVIDDEVTVRTVARRILERSGFDVLTADDGRQGADLFAERAAEIRLVLLDLTMPKLDGESALAEIRGISASVPVVLMSGFDEHDVARRFGRTDIAGFLHKPFRATDVIERVEAALAADSRRR